MKTTGVFKRSSTTTIIGNLTHETLGRRLSRVYALVAIFVVGVAVPVVAAAGGCYVLFSDVVQVSVALRSFEQQRGPLYYTAWLFLLLYESGVVTTDQTVYEVLGTPRKVPGIKQQTRPSARYDVPVPRLDIPTRTAGPDEIRRLKMAKIRGAKTTRGAVFQRDSYHLVLPRLPAEDTYLPSLLGVEDIEYRRKGFTAFSRR